MSDKRDTYCLLSEFNHRLKNTAALLGISENTLRSHLVESEIDIERQSLKTPGAPAVRIFSLEKIFEIAQWRRKSGKVKALSNRPIVVTVSLIKGGVGKSTTAAEVAIQLQLRGYKVLVVDLDSQSSLTQLLGYEPDLDLEELEQYGLSEKALVKNTFFNLIAPYIDKLKSRTREKSIPSLDEIIMKPFGEFGPSLIASDVNLDDLNSALSDAPGDREHIFRNFFQDANEGKIKEFAVKDYDFILMDCAPGVHLMTSNAIASADYLIAPVKMDFFGAKGTTRLVSEINGLKSRSSKVNPELMILPTHYSTTFSRTMRMMNHLQVYRESLVSVSIPQSEMFPTSAEHYLPLTLQFPSSAPVDAYRNFVEILIQKIQKKSNV